MQTQPSVQHFTSAPPPSVTPTPEQRRKQQEQSVGAVWLDDPVDRVATAPAFLSLEGTLDRRMATAATEASLPLDLPGLATEIRQEHGYAQGAMKKTFTHAVRAGKLLAQARKLFKRGEWQIWLINECKINPRTARVYVSLFKKYGSGSAAANSIREALDLLKKGMPDDEAVRFVSEEGGVPEIPTTPASRTGDIWKLGKHRLLNGDACNPVDVRALLSGRAPRLLDTDPPYGIGMDSGWRNRAGINKQRTRGPGHTETKIAGDSRHDWSSAFELVPSLRDGYVWHASVFQSEVRDGLRRIGFKHAEEIIWAKPVAAMTRSRYWYQHERCWYVRKRGSVWYGRPGKETTVWFAASPKMRSAEAEKKFDHPNQKPIELMQRPILAHTKPGEFVYDPFLGSGTTLEAAELSGRICLGIERDSKHVDVAVQRWQDLTGEHAVLEGDGRTFEEVASDRLRKAA